MGPYQNLILFNACIFNFLCEGGPNMSLSLSVVWAQFSSLFSFSQSNLIVALIFTWACLPHRLCREEGLKGRGAHEEFTRRRLVVQPKSWKHFPSAWARVWRGGMLCQIFEFTTQRLHIREALRKWWFLGIFPKPVDPPPSVNLGIKMWLLAKKVDFQG